MRTIRQRSLFSRWLSPRIVVHANTLEKAQEKLALARAKAERGLFNPLRAYWRGRAEACRTMASTCQNCNGFGCTTCQYHGINNIKGDQQ